MVISDLFYLTQPALGLGSPNPGFVSQMLESQRQGRSAMPLRLGLAKTAFVRMIRYYRLEKKPAPGWDIPQQHPSFMPERNDLLHLLHDHRTVPHHEAQWMATIVVTACSGSDHLWSDLGLRHRDDLSRLLLHNFRTLAQRNTGDMKWKKFLYRQLWEQEGFSLCAAPSCHVCPDCPPCFGLEHPVAQ
ncbi:MAG: nitrogen fixation protein NifQ [Magnetococcales bacterium]|nr:nitrogen fixation protein NifQ [Magnetococcales bacterium]